jgi:hypothetical protein
LPLWTVSWPRCRDLSATFRPTITSCGSCEQAIRLGDERCKAFQELLALLELDEMPVEDMGWA